MKKKPLLLLCSALLLATVAPLSARTWTDAASGRTLEGDYVSSDATHVIVRSGGKTLEIAIDRLSEADREFIKAQAAPTPKDNESPSKEAERPDPTGLTFVACDANQKILATLVVPDDQKTVDIGLTLPDGMDDIRVFVIGTRERIFNPDGETNETKKEFYEELFEANTETVFIYRRSETKNRWSRISDIEKGVMQGMSGYAFGDTKPLELTAELKQAVQQNISADGKGASIFTVTEE